MARQFGIITTTTGITSIVVNSIQRNQHVEVAEARNESGHVTDMNAYGRTETVNIRGLLDAATCAITAGSTLTLGETTYLIESCDVSETNTGFAEVTISAKLSDAATITAYTAPSGD